VSKVRDWWVRLVVFVQIMSFVEGRFEMLRRIQTFAKSIISHKRQKKTL